MNVVVSILFHSVSACEINGNIPFHYQCGNIYEVLFRLQYIEHKNVDLGHQNA